MFYIKCNHEVGETSILFVYQINNQKMFTSWKWKIFQKSNTKVKIRCIIRFFI